MVRHEVIQAEGLDRDRATKLAAMARRRLTASEIAQALDRHVGSVRRAAQGEACPFEDPDHAIDSGHPVAERGESLVIGRGGPAVGNAL